MAKDSLLSRDEPVSALAGLPAGSIFRYWRGRSGRRYLHTVHALADWPGYGEANLIFVRCQAGGRRHVLWVGQAGGHGARAAARSLFKRMEEAGANEVHVHLLAGSARARRAVERDLKAALGLLRIVD
ncbi:MAG: hypothetical protein Q8P46_12130 [Hyphomicrobiales bacterium]|nr:hypothetical protein [Hyphomicrobiales bacterium]